MARWQHPQERKRLDYLKDRRNFYGESTVASRKAIPLRRAQRHRAQRRAANASLPGAGRLPDAEVVARAEAEMLSRKPPQWRKSRDEPLANVVCARLARRSRSGMLDPDLAEARIRVILRRLHAPDDGHYPVSEDSPHLRIDHPAWRAERIESRLPRR